MADEKKTAPAAQAQLAPAPAPEAPVVPEAGLAADVPPAVISGTAQDVDNAKLPPAPKEFAGKYRLTHGSVRIGDQFFGPPSVLQLSANDGERFLNAGVAERVEG
jgi:hypothetical protein